MDVTSFLVDLNDGQYTECSLFAYCLWTWKMPMMEDTPEAKSEIIPVQAIVPLHIYLRDTET